MTIEFLIQCDTVGDIVKNLPAMTIEFLIQCDTVEDIVNNLPAIRVLDPM